MPAGADVEAGGRVPSPSLVDVYVAARWRPATLQAYGRHIAAFQSWCAEEGVCPLPATADTLVRYLEWAARSWQLPTLRVALSAIQHLHGEQGCVIDPTIARGLRGALAAVAAEPLAPPPALDRATLMPLLQALPATLLGKRNRAMLLLGFAAALRPGEIVGLDVGEPAPGGTGLVALTRDGVEILLRRSKTDHKRLGTRKVIPSGCSPCPVAALEDWLQAAKITSGVLFPSSRRTRGATPARLTGRGLLEVVRQAARLATREAGASAGRGDSRPSLSGRSLRSGFVIDATRANLHGARIAEHVGWASTKMTLAYSRSLSGDSGLMRQILDWHRTSTVSSAAASRTGSRSAPGGTAMTKLSRDQPVTANGASSAAPRLRPCDLFAPDTSWSRLMCRTRKPQFLRDYRRRFAAFATWCAARGSCAIPAAPETIGAYLLALAPSYRLNTLRNIVSAIAFVHRLNGLALVTAPLRPVWRKIARTYGGSAAAPHGLRLAQLELLLRSLPATRRGARDRAVLLLAFWGGLRAGELVGLNVGQHTPDASGVVAIGEDGIGIAMGCRGRRALPPRGAGRLLARQPELCPVAALEHWLQISGIAAGPIFRRVRRGDEVGEERLSSPNISRLVRRIWSEAFASPAGSSAGSLAAEQGFCFRSLRTGFIISAIEAGISEERIALHLGWRTTAALQTYRCQQQIRRGHPVCLVMAPWSTRSSDVVSALRARTA